MYSPSFCEQANRRIYRTGFNIRGGGANHNAIRTGTFSAFKVFFSIFFLELAQMCLRFVPERLFLVRFVLNGSTFFTACCFHVHSLSSETQIMDKDKEKD
jgi:hypothetical protein